MTEDHLSNKRNCIVETKHETSSKKKKCNEQYDFEVCNLYPEKDEGAKIRIVKPYPYYFRTFAKERWIGKTIFDVYCSEFASHSPDYYKSAIRTGLITVSEKQVPISYVVKRGDELCHIVHRHEPAVLLGENKSIIESILFEDENLLVVNKPCTMPIHPCGAYHFNTLFHILSIHNSKHHQKKLHTIHRLDRLTSGVTIIGKNPHIAKDLSKCLQNREQCSKLYLARVQGKFPLDAPKNAMYAYSQKANVRIKFGEELDENGTLSPAFGYWLSNRSDIEDKSLENGELRKIFFNIVRLEDIKNNLKKNIGTATWNGSNEINWFHFASPVGVISYQRGVYCTGPIQSLSPESKPKPAQTKFVVLKYDEDSDTTLVAAVPSTGRTHQIRLHLQFLNHAIANDPCYGGDLLFGLSEEECLAYNNACTLLQSSNSDNIFDSDKNLNESTKQDIFAEAVKTKEENPPFVRGEEEKLLDYLRRTCVWCAKLKFQNKLDDVLYRNRLEFLSHSRGIWLHALQYNLIDSDGKILSFESPIPSWSAFSNDGKKPKLSR